MKDGAPGTSYLYDELGRLKTAQTTDQVSAGTWKLGFKYDRYGNRLAQIPQGGTASMPINEVGVDSTTNRITGYQYDAAGNMTNDGLHTYSYDAENRLVSVDGTAETFVYDAAGMRVKKNSTVYIYEGGHAIAEYANGALAASPSVEYVGGFASITGGTTTYFYQDHLSNRFLANSSGAVTGTLSQFPFGELASGSASTKWAFTNYERDNAAGDSGLDYAYGRFYSNRLGRFMSMDPLSGGIANPQSLNRYAYVTNDPINMIDLTGMAGGKWNCELLDSGDCRGGNGYVPGGSGGGDIFGVNDDPFGSWTDPTRSDPLAVGEANYYANFLVSTRPDIESATVYSDGSISITGYREFAGPPSPVHQLVCDPEDEDPNDMHWGVTTSTNLVSYTLYFRPDSNNPQLGAFRPGLAPQSNGYQQALKALTERKKPTPPVEPKPGPAEPPYKGPPTGITEEPPANLPWYLQLLRLLHPPADHFSVPLVCFTCILNQYLNPGGQNSATLAPGPQPFEMRYKFKEIPEALG